MNSQDQDYFNTSSDGIRESIKRPKTLFGQYYFQDDKKAKKYSFPNLKKPKKRSAQLQSKSHNSKPQRVPNEAQDLMESI